MLSFVAFSAVQFSFAVSASSSVTQSIILDAESPFLRFDTQVSWHENRRMLKVQFPMNVRTDNATYEIQYGHVQRPTHQVWRSWMDEWWILLPCGRRDGVTIIKNLNFFYSFPSEYFMGRCQARGGGTSLGGHVGVWFRRGFAQRLQIRPFRHSAQRA